MNYVSWITAKRQLIHNRTAKRNAWNQSYDFIVVGAGTAGCVVASRLAESANTTVLVLEAGEAEDALWNDIHWLPNIISNNRPDLLWHYYGEPQANVGLQFPGGRINENMHKTLGGSSSHNGMTYNRGNRKGYDNWVTEYGAVGWSYKEVLPYFIISENNTDMNVVRMNSGYRGVNGPMQITTPAMLPLLRMFEQAYNDLGFPTIDFNGPNQTGTMFMQEYIDTRGFRVSNANSYIDPNRHPNNLHIVTRALVNRILFKRNTAIGVSFATNDMPYSVYARREVIICAGAYNSPQILMLSGIGIRSHLQSFAIPVKMDLPVGNNLINHPIVLTYSPILNTSYYLDAPRITINQLVNRYYKSSGPLGYSPLLDLYFATKKQHDKSYPNILCPLLYSQDSISIIYGCALMRPKSRGTIRLQSSSPYIAPLISTNYLDDPIDFEDIIEAARFLFFILENSMITPYLRAPSFEDYGCSSCPGKRSYQCDKGLKCYVRQNIESSHHPGGSCHMGGVDRNETVVDPFLRVKNIKNLRVWDASIFPENPNANQNAPITMIGERCAQFIKDFYRLN